jgi:hypothetical protein
VDNWLGPSSLAIQYWDKILFEQALNWEGPKLPEEAKKKLSGALESSGVGGVSWISL